MFFRIRSNTHILCTCCMPVIGQESLHKLLIKPTPQRCLLMYKACRHCQEIAIMCTLQTLSPASAGPGGNQRPTGLSGRMILCPDIDSQTQVLVRQKMAVLGSTQSSSEAIEIELSVTLVPILETTMHYKIVLAVCF